MGLELPAVLRQPMFRTFVLGNGSSLLGLWVQRVGLGWLTWDLTHSGFWLGAIAFADLSPALLLGPFAGVWADRMDRRSILLWTQSAAGLIALLLFLLVLLDAVDIGWLFLLSLGLGVCASIAQPARLALVPALVDRSHVAAAVALNSVIFNTARFIGPMIAGGLITAAHVSFTFLVNALSYGCMVYAMLRIPAGLHPVSRDADSRILGQIREGLSYAWRHDAIRRLILIITAVAVLGKPLAELLPGFADAVFGRGAAGLALMTQAMGVGALLGGLFLARIKHPTKLPAIALGCYLACGLAIAAFSLTTHFGLGLVCLMLTGMASSGAGICTQTLVQQVVEDRMRGRVMSLWGLIFRGSPSLGVLVMGAASEFSSLGTAVLVGGLCCLLGSLYARRWRASLVEAVRKA